MSEATDRLERIERELRYWRAAFATVVMVILLIAAEKKDTRSVSAHEFVLTDDQGKRRGLLHVDSTGSAALELMDANERVFATLDEGLASPESIGITSRGPGLVIFEDHRPTILLNSGSDGAMLYLSSHDASASMTASKLTGAGVSVSAGRERSGSLRPDSLTLESQATSIDLTAGDAAHVELGHASGSTIALDVSDEESSIDAYRCKRDQLSKPPLCSPTPQLLMRIRDVGASLQLDDRDGFMAQLGFAELLTPKTGTKSQTSAASIILFDQGKKVLWSAP